MNRTPSDGVTESGMFMFFISAAYVYLNSLREHSVGGSRLSFFLFIVFLSELRNVFGKLLRIVIPYNLSVVA